MGRGHRARIMRWWLPVPLLAWVTLAARAPAPNAFQIAPDVRSALHRLYDESASAKAERVARLARHWRTPSGSPRRHRSPAAVRRRGKAPSTPTSPCATASAPTRISRVPTGA